VSLTPVTIWEVLGMVKSSTITGDAKKGSCSIMADTTSTDTAANSLYLTAAEVSRMINIPVSTVQEWAAKRERGLDAPGPRHHRLSNRHRRWRLDDVQEWLDTTRV
jgi:predicted DNA-binding transcriptional regulator AlpA